jgi:hemolysin D
MAWLGEELPAKDQDGRTPNLPDRFELRPGMLASAEIKVGQRSLAAYIFHPLLRPFIESLREPSP